MTNVFDMRLILTCLSLSLLLILSTIGTAWSSSTNNTAVNGNHNTAINNTAINAGDERLQKLLAEYANWNANVPTEQLPEEGN